MSGMVRRGEVTVNRVGPFRCAAILVAVLGGLLAAPPAPAHADVYDYDNRLFVNGRTGTIEVVKRADTRVRIEWRDLPFPDIRGFLGAWEIRVSPRPLTCMYEDDGPDLAAERSFRSYINSREAAHWHWDVAIKDFHVGESYYVRACLPTVTFSSRSNQVEIRVLPEIVSHPASRPFDPTVATVPAGTPLITGIYGPTVVMPGFLIGVTGRDFGERPGQVHLQIGVATYFLTGLDWHSGSIAGRVPTSITGVPRGPAWLTVERADGRRSNSRPITFKPREEVRIMQGGEVRVDSCSNEAEDNWCRSRSTAEPDAPSFEGYHGSPRTDTDESGTDLYSVDLAIGWRVLDLEFSHGERDMPVPTAHATIRSGDESTRTHLSIGVDWRNPRGLVHHHYGFRIYIVGPEGMPYR